MEKLKVQSSDWKNNKPLAYAIVFAIFMAICLFIFWPVNASTAYESSTPRLQNAFDTQLAALQIVECELTKSKLLDFYNQVTPLNEAEITRLTYKYSECSGEQVFQQEQVTPEKKLTSQLHTSPLTIQK